MEVTERPKMTLKSYSISLVLHQSQIEIIGEWRESFSHSHTDTKGILIHIKPASVLHLQTVKP